MIQQKQKTFDEKRFVFIYLDSNEYKQHTLIGNVKTLHILKTLKKNQKHQRKQTQVNIEVEKDWLLKDKSSICDVFQSQHRIKVRYAFYGPNPVIYLGIIRRLVFFMMFFSIFIALPLIVLNSKGLSCHRDQICLQKQFTYTLSYFNIIEEKDKLIIQLVIWLAGSIILCIFFIYLRIYTLKTNYLIDYQNITQGDYGLIIRRLPQNEYNIKETLEKSFYQIKDVIFIKKKIDKQLRQNSNTAIILFNNIDRRNLILKMKRIFSYFTFLYPRSQFIVSGKRVSIDQAPEPSDIIIQNIGYSTKQRTLFKLMFNLLSIFIIGVNCTVSYYLQIAKQKIKSDFFLLDANNVVYFTLFTFLFNKIIGKLLQISINKQKLDTKTNILRTQLLTTVFHQTVNLVLFSILIPIFINRSDLFTSLKNSKFPTAIVILISFKAFVSFSFSFLLNFFQISQKLYRIALTINIIKKSQKEANQLLKGTQINFSQKFVDLIQLFWFSIIFSIVSPLCIVIATVGFILFNFYERILFLKCYSIPLYTNVIVSFSFIDKLEYIVLFIGLSNLLVHVFYSYLQKTQLNSTIFLLSLSNLILGFVLNILPLNSILKKLKYEPFINQQMRQHQQNKFLKNFGTLNIQQNLLDIIFSIVKNQTHQNDQETNRALKPSLFGSSNNNTNTQ